MPVFQFSPICIIPSLLQSFIHLPPTLYNVFSQYFSFPLFVSFDHCSTRSSNYHTQSIMFVSKYFSFTLSVSFYHSSTHSFYYHPRCIMFLSHYFSFTFLCHSIIAPLIHSSTTHIVYFCIQVLQFSPVCIIPSLLYSFINLPPILYIFCIPVLKFSPVCIIP